MGCQVRRGCDHYKAEDFVEQDRGRRRQACLLLHGLLFLMMAITRSDRALRRPLHPLPQLHKRDASKDASRRNTPRGPDAQRELRENRSGTCAGQRHADALEYSADDVRIVLREPAVGGVRPVRQLRVSGPVGPDHDECAARARGQEGLQHVKIG